MFHLTCNCSITEQGRCRHYNLPPLQDFKLSPCTCLNPLVCQHSEGNVRFSFDQTFKCRHTHLHKEGNDLKCMDCDTQITEQH